MHEGHDHGGMCKCPHHKAIPLFIVLIGVVFLLNALEVVGADFTSTAWPILVILIGLMKMSSGMCSCCK